MQACLPFPSSSSFSRMPAPFCMIPSRVFIIYDILNMVSTMLRHVRVVVSFLSLVSCAMRFMHYDSMSDFIWGAVLISRFLHARISYIHRAALRVMTMCCAALCHVTHTCMQAHSHTHSLTHTLSHTLLHTHYQTHCHTHSHIHCHIHCHIHTHIHTHNTLHTDVHFRTLWH